MSATWWSPVGLRGYLGHALHDGLEWSRHDTLCKPGLWRVDVTGWGFVSHAVVDDFGNLVKVPS
jgi:hypothetical protein